MKNKVIKENLKLESFKQINYEDIITIPRELNEILEITDITIDPVIKKHYVINTIRNTSFQNQTLTGNKLIIKMILNIIIEYICNDELNSSRGMIKRHNLSTYIILSSDYKIGTDIKIRVDVDNVFYRIIEKRNLLLKIDLNIQALTPFG